MRTILLISILIFIAATIYAQDSTKKSFWTKKGSLNLNVAQGGATNWAAGAEKFSLALSGIFNYEINYNKGRKSWSNSLTLNYAFINTQSLGYRKLDDRIDFVSKYEYQLKNDSKFWLGIQGNFRTQFIDGFNYNNTSGNKRTSSFMAPAIVTASVGVTWKPNKWFNWYFAPVSSRYIIVTNRPSELAPLYGVDPSKKFAYEIGAFSSLNLDKEITKNIHFKSKLELYSNYRNKPANIDVFFTNVITLKVNKWLSTTYNFDLIYDDDAVNPQTGGKWGTQIKSLLGVGFAANF